MKQSGFCSGESRTGAVRVVNNSLMGVSRGHGDALARAASMEAMSASMTLSVAAAVWSMSMMYVPTKGHGYVAGLLTSEGYAELAPLLTCRESWSCLSPGQHSKAGTDGVGTVEMPPLFTLCGRWESWPHPLPEQHGRGAPLLASCSTKESGPCASSGQCGIAGHSGVGTGEPALRT